MSLLKQWQDCIDNQTKDTFESFWEEYSSTESKIYGDILNNYKQNTKGSFEELRAKYDVTDLLFMGFLDGINSSIKKEMNLESFTGESQVELDIDFEKLYFNMLSADADHLYTLPEWDAILTEEKRSQISKAYKKSKTIIKGEQVGRNDPCPCGSGKKFKKCCGA